MVEPLVVTRGIPDLGLEMQKFKKKRVSLRYRREECFFLQTSLFSDQEQGCLHFWPLSPCVLWNLQVE